MPDNTLFLFIFLFSLLFGFRVRPLFFFFLLQPWTLFLFASILLFFPASLSASLLGGAGRKRHSLVQSVLCWLSDYIDGWRLATRVQRFDSRLPAPDLKLEAVFISQY
jgi:hypothetical protein